MIKQTLAVFGAATMLGVTSIALANDAPAPTAAPTTTGEGQTQQVDARSTDSDRKPDGGVQESAKQ